MILDPVGTNHNAMNMAGLSLNIQEQQDLVIGKVVYASAADVIASI